MKKQKKFLLIALGCLVFISTFVWNYLVRYYPYEILSLRSYLTEIPPITWNGITVDYKFGMHVIKHESSITIHYWGKEGEEGVGIFLRSKPTKDLLRERKSSDGMFTEISGIFAQFKGNDAYIEEKIKKTNNRYMKLYHVLNLPIAFGYGGPPERMAVYEEVINSISFSNSTLQANMKR